MVEYLMSSDVHVDATTGLEVTSDAEDVHEVLAHPRRKAILSILSERETSLQTTDLATQLAALEADKPLVEVTEEEHRTVRVSLHHVHLPKLDDYGVVDWNTESGEVSLESDVSVREDRFTDRAARRSNVGSGRFFRILADERRRRVLSILSERGGSVSTTDLATRVAAQEVGTRPENVPRSAIDRVEVSLHHSHLPSMSAVGLLEYEPDDERVAYDGPLSLPLQ